jgi:D-alanyl-D-alanine dipeptidase
VPICAFADPAPADFVDLLSLEPSLRVELRYATTDNFMHRAVYPPSARCYLRGPVAEKLQAVQRELQPLGLGLKLYDCYRPLSVQRLLWQVVPDERYVARPEKGSRHNRGAAVDLTLVDKQGRELPMPTPFDAFDERAHRDYDKLPPEVLKNRALLESAMVKRGFVPLATEWWHFDAADFKDYPLADVGFDVLSPSPGKRRP